ncbi:MAG: methylated-DNA--[protein]-cysteine S-methyltransferase [Alphaproteobacteria bacterium]
MRAHTLMLFYTHVGSPIGRLLIAGDGERLHLISFPTGSRAHMPKSDWRRDDGLFTAAVDQLRAYFAGALTRFDLPLRLAGTPFQNAVWSALRDIPYGETISYQTLATRIGRPTACRAVGAANGANPLPIVVPCHRVIGADGSLTGFGGGIETKRALLDHERGQIERKRAG